MDPEQQLYLVLRCATDSDIQVVRDAQEQLLSWEQQPNFFVSLARLCFSNISGEEQAPEKLDTNARWMAAVYLKNAVNKYWKRSGRQFELPDTEKQQIRMLLLTNFGGERVQQVSIQIAVLIGRIARIDFPRDWPELLPFILERLQKYSEEGKTLTTNELAEQQKFLLVLLHVIKAVASRRIMADKILFENLTNNIFPFVQRLWNDFTNMFFQQLNDLNSAFDALNRAHLTLRMLRKLSTFGYSKRHKFECGFRFFQQLFVCLEQCLQCRYELRQHLESEMPFIKLLEKFILKQMKILNDFQEMHSTAFVRFLPTALEFSFQHVFHERARLIFTDNEINFPHFAIQCINLMKGVMISCHYSASTSTSTLAVADADQSFSFVLSDFFTKDRLSYICEKIITHYFLLTRNELQKWDDDPEGFAQDDGGERYKYELRPCVESFYLTCFNNNQTTIVSDVLKFVEKAQQITLTPDSDLKNILLKDAIYNAVGITALHFYNDIDFNAWFSSQLLAELRIDSNNFRILRKRIIWLVAEFAPVKFSRDLRPLAYEACLHLLRPDEDMSVRIVASRTLCALISDFEFAPVAFLPYLESAFNALFVLLVNAKECETKMTILSNMSVVVETVNDHIEPVADKLITYLPLLWKESEEYQMLRCSIIFALQHIVRAIHDIPEAMKPFLFEVIEFSTDVRQPSHIYLIEEGLILWVEVVENSTSLSVELLNLCKQIQSIVDMSTEHLRTIFVLVQGYILLDAHAYLELYGQQFVDFCQRLFHDIRAEGIVYMMKVLETCLKAEPRHGLHLIRPLLPPIFEEVYKDESFPSVLSMNLMMLARTLMIDQITFTEIVQTLPLPNAMEKILDIWITKMPLVRDLDKRKLYCLAFASILSSNHRILHERFAAIIQNISDALYDIMMEEDDSQDDDSKEEEEITATRKDKKPKKYYDSLVYTEANDFDTSGYCTMEHFLHDSHHYDRCRQLSLKDPLHQIALNQYVNFQLESMRQQMGEDGYKRLWQTVPHETCTNISRFIKVPL